MNDAVLVALIVAVPPTLTAAAGLIVAISNGLTARRTSEKIAAGVAAAQIQGAEHAVKLIEVGRQVDGRMEQMLKLQQEAAETREKSRDDERAAERASIHAAEIAAAREAGRGERK